MELEIYTGFSLSAARSCLPQIELARPYENAGLESQRKPQANIYLLHLQAIQGAQEFAQIALVEGHYLTYVDDRVLVQARAARCQGNITRCSSQPQI